MNHLQGRFPDVTVARLRIKFVIARKFGTGIIRADGTLIKPAVVADLKCHGKIFCFQTERFVRWQRNRRRRAGIHFNFRICPVGMIVAFAVTAVRHAQNQCLDAGEIHIHRFGGFSAFEHAAVATKFFHRR